MAARSRALARNLDANSDPAHTRSVSPEAIKLLERVMPLPLLCLVAACGSTPIAPPDAGEDTMNDTSMPDAPVTEAGPDSDGATDADVRHFMIGALPVPMQPDLDVLPTTESWIETFDVLAATSEVVLVHAHPGWEAFVTGPDEVDASDESLAGVEFTYQMAERRGLELLIVVDYRALDGSGLGAPDTVGGSFSDPEVRAAFTNYSIRLARDYQPAFMGLGAEVNTFLDDHPEEIDGFLSLVEETIDRVRDESSSIIVSSSIQYEELVGLVDGEAQWDLLERVNPIVDAIAITTYPSLFFDGLSSIPGDYYEQIGTHTDLPVLIAESGYPSGGDAGWHGSPSKQREFVEGLSARFVSLDLRLWIYWFLHDHEGYPPFFQTMGLRTSTGEPKPAFTAWEAVHAVPLEN